jgi:hypothetical protein
MTTTICARCEREIEVGKFEVKDGEVIELEPPTYFVCDDCRTDEERESGVLTQPTE